MPEDNRIRVFVTDDHAVVRRGLCSFLCSYDDFDLVGEAKNGDQAVALCSQLQPDVVLMDLVMPGTDGAAATRMIRQEHPGIQVIALTSYKDHDLVENALQAGAIGYLLKDISADELAAAIRAAAAGKPTLAPEAAQVLLQNIRSPQDQPGFDISAREREVLDLMAEGLNNDAIAQRLCVSLSTVKSHVSSILSKLGVTSRTEAVSLALKHKL